MPLKLVVSKTLPIGVDLGTTAVKMAQLRLLADVTELSAVGRIEVPPGDPKKLDAHLESLSAAIRQLLQTRPFRGRQAILSLPAEHTVVQHVKTPRIPPAEMAKALQWELQGKLPFAFADGVIRHVVAGEVFGEGEARQEVIVIAASRLVVDAYLKMARRAGLEVVGLNVEPCAIVECFGRLFRRADDASRSILFVDIGSATTQVAISHGNQLVFARNVMIGGRHLDETVAKGLGITTEQARLLRRQCDESKDPAAADELYRLLESPMSQISDEMTQSLRYYESVFRGRSVERAIFVGGQANDRRLCQWIAQRLNVPAQVGDPLVRVRRSDGPEQGGPDRRSPQPDWAVAVGLSYGAQAA